MMYIVLVRQVPHASLYSNTFVYEDKDKAELKAIQERGHGYESWVIEIRDPRFQE